MRLISIAFALLFAGSVLAEPLSVLRDRDPDFFDTETGLRIAQHRAPTPDDIPPPAQRIDTAGVQAQIANGALLLDVFGAQSSRYDELDGTWLVSKPRESLPGAVWLPEVGRGVLEPEIETYLADGLARFLEPDQSLVVFCIADCWMSWNAAQRIAAMGYSAVYWYAEGTSGWTNAGMDLEVVDPVPVNVD